MNQVGQGGPGSAGDLPDLRRRRDQALSPTAPREPTEVTMVGTVRRVEVEGGAWVLETDDGGRFELLGDLDPARGDDRMVVIGRLRPDLATTAQVGPVLEVDLIGPVARGREDTGQG